MGLIDDFQYDVGDDEEERISRLKERIIRSNVIEIYTDEVHHLATIQE